MYVPLWFIFLCSALLGAVFFLGIVILCQRQEIQDAEADRDFWKKRAQLHEPLAETVANLLSAAEVSVDYCDEDAQ